MELPVTCGFFLPGFESIHFFLGKRQFGRQSLLAKKGSLAVPSPPLDLFPHSVEAFALVGIPGRGKVD